MKPHIEPPDTNKLRPDLASIPLDPTPRPAGDSDWRYCFSTEDMPQVAMMGIEPNLARVATDPCSDATGIMGIGCALTPLEDAYALTVEHDGLHGGCVIANLPMNGTRIFCWQDRLLIVSEPPEKEDSARITLATRTDGYGAGAILDFHDDLGKAIGQERLTWARAAAIARAKRQERQA